MSDAKLTILLAKGIQDYYINTSSLNLSSKNITFFKTVYKRHTPFYVESSFQNFEGIPNFGEKLSCTINKNGDLITKMYLVITLPSINVSGFSYIAWMKKIGFGLIKNLELQIGDTIIDRRSGDFLNCFYSLNNDIHNLDYLIGNSNISDSNSNITTLHTFSQSKNSFKMYIPLNYWFCNFANMALPIVSLHSNNVKINLELESLNKCLNVGPTNSIKINESVILFTIGETISQIVNNITSYAIYISYDLTNNLLNYISLNGSFVSGTQIVNSSGFYVNPISSENNVNVNIDISNLDINLLVTYIYLDNIEKLKVLKSNHEFLIEQIQTKSFNNINFHNISVKLPFKNLIKEIFFRGKLKFLNNNYKEMNYLLFPNSDSLIKEVKIVYMGNDASEIKDGDFYSIVNPILYHDRSDDFGINIINYSFYPKNSQPFGFLNFSKLYSVSLDLLINKEISNSNMLDVNVYAITYNVLSIKNGVVSLLFD